MQLSALPFARIIDSPKKLHQMVEDLKKQPFIAVDTESNSLHAYQEQVCLIQISTIKTDYLIDTIALSDLDESLKSSLILPFKKYSMPVITTSRR